MAIEFSIQLLSYGFDDVKIKAADAAGNFPIEKLQQFDLLTPNAFFDIDAFPAAWQ